MYLTHLRCQSGDQFEKSALLIVLVPLKVDLYCLVSRIRRCCKRTCTYRGARFSLTESIKIPSPLGVCPEDPVEEVGRHITLRGGRDIHWK